MSGTDYTLTPRLGLFKPITDADVDQWGTHWNLNADTLDAVALLSDVQGVYLPLGGGTMTGPITLSGTPTADLHAAPKSYVDLGLSSKLGDAPSDGKAYSRRNAAWTSVPYYDGANNVVLAGQLFAQNGMRVSAADSPRWTLNETDAPFDQKFVDAFVDANGNFMMQFVNDAFNAGNQFFQAVRSGYAVSSVSLTAPQIVLSGAASVSQELYVDGGIVPSRTATGYGYYLYGDATYRYIRFTNDGWRLLFNASTGNLQFDHPSGQGQHVWYGNGNYWARGDITANVNIYGQRIRATNGVMSTNGHFFVADNDAYRLSRDSDGYWRFYENSQWNFSVAPNGDCYTRGVNYAQGHLFSMNSVYWGNDWAHRIGNGGSGSIIQFAPGYYWDYHGSTGAMIYMFNSVAHWVIHFNSTCYNNRAWTGGFGPYVDLSDERYKQEIEPARYGLDEILRLRPIRFRRKPRVGMTYEPEVGFSAQAVQALMPEAVHPMDIYEGEGDPGTPSMGLATTPIVAALVRAVQQLTERIEELEQAV